MWSSMVDLVVLVVMAMCLMVRHASAVAIGEICILDADCSAAYSECAMQYTGCEAGICTCKTEYYQFNDECRPESQMSEPCLKDEDCLSTTVNSICERDSMTCTCEDGELFEDVDDVLACYKSAAGTACSLDDDCLTYQLDREHGRCVILDGNENGTCGCVESLNLKGEECRPSHYWTTCGADGVFAECITNTVCTNVGHEHWFCTCPNETISYDSYFHTGHNQCVHNEATLKLPAGEPCDNEYLEPDGRMCSLYYNLVCAECPGTEDSICLEPYEISDGVTETPDGASSVSTYSSIVLALFTIISLTI